MLVYSVFFYHVQTDTGRIIIREHNHDQNCPLIYNKLVHKYSNSPEAQMNAQELFTNITNLRLDENCKSTATNFLNICKGLYLQIEEVVPLDEHEGPTFKKK